MMTRHSFRHLVLAAAATVCLAPASASAALVYLGTEAEQGTGLGTVNTILSLSPQGNGTAGCGQIGFNDVTSACEGTNVTFAGGSNNQTYTFAELGIVTAADLADLRFVFNVNEPDDAVTLSSLSALFFTSSGAALHTATYTGPLALDEIGGGIGGQGHVFALDATSIAAIGAVNSSNVVGARFSVLNAAGGFETLNVGLFDDEQEPNEPDPVPEPTLMALVGMGLLGTGLLRRRSN